MSIINFTIEFDLFASQTDSADVGADSDVVALTGSVIFTPVFQDDRPVLSSGFSPRPAGVKLQPISGHVDSDGQLKAAPGGSVGVRLPANDPILELERLVYRVDFNVRTTTGEKVTVEGGYFEAPTADVVINLTDVLEPTGVSTIGTAPTYMTLDDASVFGKRLAQAANANTARDILYAASDYDFRLDDTRTPTDGSVTLSKLEPTLSTYLDGIQSTYLTINQIGLVNGASVADATTKNTAFGVFHYDRSLYSPFYGVRMESAAAGNYLQLGGGYSAGSAASLIQFFVADDNITPTGLLIGLISSSGLSLGRSTLAGQVTVSLNAVAGNHRTLAFQAAGVARWNVRANDSAESGSDTGSDFEIQSRTDAGSAKTVVFKIDRATDVTTFGGQVVLMTSTTSYASVRLPHGTAPSAPTNGDLWTTTAGMFSRINGVTERVPLFNEASPSDLTTGESTLPRHLIIGTAGSGNNNLRLTYFTAKKTETITQVRMTTGSTAAVGATLCRIGIYEEDSATGNLTLVASTANDTTLWASGSTAYTRNLSASLSKVRGRRYAVGLLVVGTSTAPTFAGHAALSSTEAGIAPRLGGLVGSQTDLPSSISSGSISAQSNLSYVALV